MASPERIQEVEAFIANLRSWAADRADIVAVAIVGSWARDGAREDSDIDVVLLTDNPSSYLEGNEWIAGLAPSADLLRTGEWRAIEERRLLLPSGLEIEIGVGLPSWADTAPVDPGTRAVVRDGLHPVFDRRGLLAKLAAVCRGST